MALFTTLYSGSSGNCALILHEGKYLLIDMGKSCRTTLNALRSLGLAVSDCEGILITHEHSDHVSGLDTFFKHYSVPVYGCADTTTRSACTVGRILIISKCALPATAATWTTAPVRPSCWT